MALKAVLKTLDGLDEGTKALYKQGSGEDKNFYLDLDTDSIKSHPATKPLATTLEKFKKQVEEKDAALAKWDGRDPDKYDEMQRERDAAAEKLRAATDPNGEAARQQAAREAKYKTDTDKLKADHTAAITKANTTIRRLVVDSGLDAAIEAAGVLTEYRPAVKALFREKRIDVIEEGEDVRGVFKTDLGDEAISDHIAGWAKTPAANHYLPPDRKIGSDAPKGPQNSNTKGVSTFNGSDPIAWGQNAAKVATGEARPA